MVWQKLLGNFLIFHICSFGRVFRGQKCIVEWLLMINKVGRFCGLQIPSPSIRPFIDNSSGDIRILGTGAIAQCMGSCNILKCIAMWYCDGIKMWCYHNVILGYFRPIWFNTSIHHSAVWQVHWSQTQSIGCDGTPRKITGNVLGCAILAHSTWFLGHSPPWCCRVQWSWSSTVQEPFVQLSGYQLRSVQSIVYLILGFSLYSIAVCHSSLTFSEAQSGALY